MRLMYAAVVWLVFIGGVWLYMNTREEATAPGPAQLETPTAAAVYGLRVRATFVAAVDPFALEAPAAEEMVPVEIRVNGRPQTVIMADDLEVGAVYRVTRLSGLHSGDNEIYIAASPPAESADRTHAVRLELLSEGRVVQEKTIWSDGTGRVAGVFMMNIPEEKDSEEGEGVR
jgi:hypothetical protein